MCPCGIVGQIWVYSLISRVVVLVCNPTSNGGVFLYLHSLTNVLSPEVLTLAILIGVSWNLRVILIYISLMTEDVEHIFRYFSAI